MKSHMLKSLLLTTSIGLCLSAAQVNAAPAGQPASAAVSQAQTEQRLLRIEKILAGIPDSTQVKVQKYLASLGYQNTEWAGLVNNAINPDDYQCSETQFRPWVKEQVKDWDADFGLLLDATKILDLPMVYAIDLGSESKSNTFGIDGQYTQLLTSQMRDLKKFWDIPSAGIELRPLHSADVFASVDRIAQAYVVMKYDPASAQKLAEFVYEWVQSEPRLRGGAHPMLSLNAMALDLPPEMGLPKMIVMGDGVMQAMAALGLDVNAPRAILAHEFGHHVQFADNLLDDERSPESARRAELMADAFSLYFLTHARGEALNAKRLLPSLQAQYEVGDCGFDSPGHHGTPNQRMRASQWAADKANDAQKQGHIAPSMVFAADFDRALPELVAPDAP